MLNRIKEKRRFRTNVANYTAESWLAFMETGRLNLFAYYQRDYVWTEVNQQEFLNNIIEGFPLGGISVVKTTNPETHRTVYEVVDGKQRITTLEKFWNDEISIILEGSPVKYSELSEPEKMAFCNVSLPMITLENATEKEKLEYFYSINFSGVPQSNEHKEKIISLIKNS